ncbi:32338_t:CDS:2, partial [Gigaspora margarita]
CSERTGNPDQFEAPKIMATLEVAEVSVVVVMSLVVEVTALPDAAALECSERTGNPDQELYQVLKVVFGQQITKGDRASMYLAR